MWRVLSLSLFMIGAASAGFVYSLSQVRTLRMTRLFLAFCAVVGSVQLAFWFFWGSVQYNAAYWAFDFLHNVLLCFLSAEIIKALLPRRLAIRWIGIALFIPLIALIVRLPLGLPAAMVILSTSASFTGGILLMSLFPISVNWTKEHRMATAGVVAVLIGDLLSFFGSTGHSGPLLTSAVQLAPLLGLILLSLAGRSKQMDKLKREDAGKPPEMPSPESSRGGHAA